LGRGKDKESREKKAFSLEGWIIDFERGRVKVHYYREAGTECMIPHSLRNPTKWKGDSARWYEHIGGSCQEDLTGSEKKSRNASGTKTKKSDLKRQMERLGECNS